MNVVARGLVQKDVKVKDIVKQHSVYCQNEKDTKMFGGETLGYVTPVSETLASLHCVLEPDTLILA